MGTFPTWVTRLRGVAYFSILHIASFTGAVFLLGSIKSFINFRTIIIVKNIVFISILLFSR